MATAITFIPKNRDCQYSKSFDESTHHVFRSKLTGIIPQKNLEAIFPPDESLHGIDLEFFSDYVIIRPIGMPVITINGHVLEDEHFYLVNIDAKDVLTIGDEKFIITASLID
jgi:hypothetical protein